MKKVLLTGSSGLVGSRLVELLRDKYELLTPEEKELNLLDKDSISAYFKNNQPDVVVNLAAFTDVNAAEEQTGDKQGICWKLNVDGAKSLLEFLPEKSRFIQISTDMVFSGGEQDPGPYAEDHSLPQDEKTLTWYGWTKNRADQAVLDANQTILRIIYPVRASFPDKLDYIRSVLKRYSDGKMFPLFKDQQVSIAFIDQVASVLSTIIDKDLTGVFHSSSTDVTTPFELNKHVLDKLGEDSSDVKQSSLKDYLKTLDNPYRYPLFGGLKTEISAQKTGVKYYTWKEIVDQLISQGLSL